MKPSSSVAGIGDALSKEPLLSNGRPSLRRTETWTAFAKRMAPKLGSRSARPQGERLDIFQVLTSTQVVWMVSPECAVG